MPEMAVAQGGGLVTCDGVATFGGVECNFCTFAAMVERVLDFVVTILIFVAVIMLAITGIQMAYTAAGNGDARAILKDRLTKIIIGFFLIIASWVIVDTIIKVLVVDEKVLTWQNFLTSGTAELCGKSMVSQNIDLVSSDPDGDYDSPDTVSPGVTPTGELVNYAGAKFDSSIVGNVEDLATEFGLRVSGGHRTPERNKEVNGSPTSYHLTGKAADFVGTMSQMEAARAKALSNGARKAFIHDAGSGTHLHISW